MKISIPRNDLLKPLQQASNVIERRQIKPILSHFLLHCEAGALSATATDTEIEVHVLIPNVTVHTEGTTSAPAKKLVDICQALNERELDIETTDQKMSIKAGKSRFNLMSLDVTTYPTFEYQEPDTTFSLDQLHLRKLIEKTAFSMAQQDVRNYLNGILLEVRGSRVRSVATDGHRLAISTVHVPEIGEETDQKVIIPRKTVQEIKRLLTSGGAVSIGLSPRQIRVTFADQSARLTSKLINESFPNYEQVIPVGNDKVLSVEREQLIQKLSLVSVLSYSDFRGVTLDITGQSMQIRAKNQENEQAEDEIAIDYAGEDLKVAMNVSYLLDVLNAIDEERIEMRFRDASSSCLIVGVGNEQDQYVIMPMRI